MKEVRHKNNAQEAKLDKSIAIKYGLLKRYCDHGLALQQSGKLEAKWTSLDFQTMIGSSSSTGRTCHPFPKCLEPEKRDGRQSDTTQTLSSHHTLKVIQTRRKNVLHLEDPATTNSVSIQASTRCLMAQTPCAVLHLEDPAMMNYLKLPVSTMRCLAAQTHTSIPPTVPAQANV
jgi:hypothetical protein